MAGIREIRRRIRSIKSTEKITKAMEMVAASKMRRAQQRVIAARPYAERMRDVLADLAARVGALDEAPHPLLEQRPVNRLAIVLVTGDRGLCGGFNGNMNRRAASFMLEQEVPVSLVTVGRRGRDFMVRYGRDLRAEFSGLGDYPNLIDTLPISRVVIDDYVDGTVDKVYLAYTQFVNTMVQRPTIRQLLPIEPAEAGPNPIEYIYEPSPQAVLSDLLPRFVEMQVYHAILESLASFHSAQMVAMRSATDNARDMIQQLTLTYNKARQEMITKELLEIAGGAEALT